MGVFVMFIVLALGWIHYNTVRGSIMQDVYKQRLISDLKAHQSELLIILEKAMETSLTLADDPAFIDWFSANNLDPEIKNIALHKLNYLHEQLGYPSVFAVNKLNHEYWCENYTLLEVVSEADPDDSWFFETLKNKRKSTLNFDYNNVLKQSMLFVNVVMGTTENPVGVAGVGIDPSTLIKQFSQNKPSKDSYLWLINAQGKILLSENTDEINENISSLFEANVVSELLGNSKEQIIREVHFKEDEFELVSMLVGSTDYKVVMIIPQKDLLAILDVIGYNTAWLTIIVLILALIVSSVLAKNVSRPIVHLAKLSKLIAHTKLNVEVTDKLIKRKDEIGQLAKEFHSMQKQLSQVITNLNHANTDLENEKQQLKRINIELESAIDKASESERLTKAFMANISHEVRTPMNSIMGFAQLLEMELQNEVNLKPYAHFIVENGNQLLAILNSIIEVAKMDSGITKPSLSIVSVKSIVEESVQLFNINSNDNVKLINKVEPSDNTTLTTDELLVKRILNNLISNAIKYTKEGTIEVGYFTENKSITFYVSDTGIGISNEDQSSIFKPFWQVQNSSSVNNGAGLGLAISQKMVEILQGKIWVESAPDKGSVFYFSLPL